MYGSIQLTASSLFGALICALLLSGCTSNEKSLYVDANEPEAAKLRYLSDMTDASIGYFDAEHCAGKIAGKLNGGAWTQSQRQVGMTIAPLYPKRDYLEIKLKPLQGEMLRVLARTHGLAFCTVSVNFTPQPNAEYELVFNKYPGNKCKAELSRLRHFDGKDTRTAVITAQDSLPSCAGSGPLFPTVATLPDTPQRLAWIERIVQATVSEQMRPTTQKPKVNLDRLIAQSKEKFGANLPDDYWQRYRQNVATYYQETAELKDLALPRYIDAYKTRLRSVDDQHLQTWAGTRKIAQREGPELQIFDSMATFYTQESARLEGDILFRHQERMVELDTQYDVCKTYSDCWRAGKFLDR